jgi:transcriptional repressor NrdR
MKCPKCKADDDHVIDSRSCKDGDMIRRRRECNKCTHRFTTYETIEREDLQVVKTDGRMEPFEKRKILYGLRKACEKRPIRLENLENIVDKMVEELENEHGLEIPSLAIGEKVMSELKKLDEVAYVRFASVYRKFKDIQEFVHEVQKLNPEQSG